MRNKRTWLGTAAIGIAMVGLLMAGCSDRGSGAVGDAVEIPEVQADDPGQVAEAPPVADPAQAVEEQAAVDDEHDAISQKIDELFARLSAESDENAQLLETIAELQRDVRKLQLQLKFLRARIAGESSPVRPASSIATPLDSRPDEAVEVRRSASLTAEETSLTVDTSEASARDDLTLLP